MSKSALHLVPWDVLTVVEIAPEKLIVAAKMWWCREVDRLPCTVPHSHLHGVGRVLEFGSRKYAERGWEKDAAYHTASGHFSSLMRHGYSPGLDDESGLLHEWHAMCRYMMLTALLARGVLIDDRPPQVLREDEVLQPHGTFVTPGGRS